MTDCEIKKSIIEGQCCLVDLYVQYISALSVGHTVKSEELFSKILCINYGIESLKYYLKGIVKFERIKQGIKINKGISNNLTKEMVELIAGKLHSICC